MLTALYYPYIQPPESWLKQMLLFYDEAASIVPPGHSDPILEWLQAQGAYSPIFVDELPEDVYLRRILIERLRLYRNKVQRRKWPNVQYDERAELFLGVKLPPWVLKRLVKERFAVTKLNHGTALRGVNLASSCLSSPVMWRRLGS